MLYLQKWEENSFEYNFLNDSNYAKMYVRDKSKTQGQMKIKYTLKQNKKLLRITPKVV